MNTSPKRRVLRKLLHGTLAATMLASMLHVDAAIIFQNDETFEMDADNLIIDFNNDTDGTDVYVQFGNSGTDGTINWDISNTQFEVSQDFNFQGGTVTIESGAIFDGSEAASFEIRAEADVVDGVTTCTTDGEVAIDLGEDALYICVTNGTDDWELIGANVMGAQASSIVTYASDGAADTGFGGSPSEGDVYYNTTDDVLKMHDGSGWVTVGPQDFEDVFAADSDNTLDTGGNGFTIDLDDTTDGTFTVNSGTGGIDFDGGAGTFDFTDDSNFTLASNDASDTTLTISSTNAGAGDGLLSITSDNWSVNTDGDASLVDITSTAGNVDFSAATSTQITEDGDGIANNTCASEGELVYDTTANTVYVCTDAGTDTWVPVGGETGSSEILNFHPEFPNAIYYEDGSSNKGKLEILYDGTQETQYYEWTTKKNNPQDLNIKFRFPLPADFGSIGDLTVEMYNEVTDRTENNITITISEDTGTSLTSCFSNTASNILDAGVDPNDFGAATTWNTVTVASASITGCTLTAGDIIELDFFMLADDTNDAFVRLGNVVLDYSTAQ